MITIKPWGGVSGGVGDANALVIESEARDVAVDEGEGGIWVTGIIKKGQTKSLS